MAKAGHAAFSEHQFGANTDAAEKKVNLVFALTFFMMIAEITAGSLYGSMALLADGWHMFTHAAAFAIALFVYWYAKKHRANTRFSFGTGKVTSLGGFASAVALLVVALMMVMESFERIIWPNAIRFEEAIMVACLGLIVNVISAVLLHDSHHHHHDHQHHDHHHKDIDHHEHEHSHRSHSHDHNLKAAYFHVLADTLTSVFAIVALIVGKLLGWVWADALMGIVGSVVIAKWAWGLIQQSSAILLDQTSNEEVLKSVQSIVEHQGDQLLDFHYWRLSANDFSLIISVASDQVRSPDFYKQKISELIAVAHITVEINAASAE